MNFAEKVYRRKNEGTKQVSIYEVDEERLFAECAVLKFDSPDEEWLDFVGDNRSGNYSGKDTAVFKINAMDINGEDILAQDACAEYTGKTWIRVP